MAKDTLLIADDLSERSAKGRLRSRLLRENAIKFARSLNLQAELVYVHDLAPGLFKRKDLQILEDSFVDIDKAIREQFAQAKVNGQVRIKSGSPAAEILTQIQSSPKYQILAMGTHKSGRLNVLRLGNITEEVLRHAPVPVMVLGPEAQSQKHVMKLDKPFKILLMTDLSESSHAAEFFAIWLCQRLHCSVDVMHCLGDRLMKTRLALYGSGYIPFNPEQMFSEMTSQAQKKINRLVHNWKDVGVQAFPLLCTREENIEKTFLKHIKKDYQFVVTGTHGRNTLLTSFLGSVARMAIDKSPVPVFVVRSVKRFKTSKTSS